MSSVEEKANGQFTKGIREKIVDEKGFGTDRIIFKEDELSYALGKQGGTRKKLALASGCIIQYVGHVCFLAGERAERKRAREFLTWLLQQRRGQVTVDDISGRDDVTEVHVPDNCKGWVTGNRGTELRRMELETGTYMFMSLDKRGDERLLIFGVDAGTKTGLKGRAAAERLVNEMIQDKLRGDERGRGRDSRSRSRSPPRRGRSGSRRRSRTPARRRSPSPQRRRSPSPQRRRSPSRRGRSDSRRRR
ncbi:unnamed protein product [Polarella glacialis]|uniref:K Homology domain-containing protein n=1 Tax=Polarella glacialis TaxID=89957 RepID=A0A813DBD8_POLGL|nr:unnamed protein product [Polarella glacialis]